MAARLPHKPSSLAGAPALVPMGHHTGKPPIPLMRPVMVMGSRANARIHLVSSTVSKAHALLVQSNGGVYIADLASRGHVYVNGERVRDADLNNGDLVKIGSFTFLFKSNGQRGAGSDAPPAALEVTGGDFPIPVEQRVILIGRRNTCDIVLLEESCSTAHAVIFEMDGQRYIRDLGSRTGTFVNGVSTHQQKLSPGDLVRIGETDIRYQTEAPATPPVVASESATGYSLEAPHDEVELAPADESAAGEHETIGGLDLVGEIVQEEIATQRVQRDRLSAGVPELDASNDPVGPLELEALDQPTQTSAITPYPTIAAANTDIAVHESELSAPEETSSVVSDDAETDARASRQTAKDEAAASEPAEVPLAPQGMSPSGDIERDDQESPATEIVVDDDDLDEAETELQPRRGWRSALEDVEHTAQPEHDTQQTIELSGLDDDDEPAEQNIAPPASAPEPAAQSEQLSEVMRFPDSLSTSDSFDSGLDSGGTAVLDRDALAPAEVELDSFEIPEDSLSSDVGGAIEPISGIKIEPTPELKLDFSDRTEEPAVEPVREEPADLSNLQLDLREEPLAQPDLTLEPPAEEPLDFTIKEPAKPLLDLDKFPAPPPLALSREMDAFAPEIEPLPDEHLEQQAAGAAVETPGIEASIEPFTFEEPKLELPPIELPEPQEPRWEIEDVVIDDAIVADTTERPRDRERDVEILDSTQPTPESALDLDIAASEVQLEALTPLTDRPLPEPLRDEELSDTGFGRAVEEFTGTSSGDLVEAASASAPAPAPAPPSAQKPTPQITRQEYQLDLQQPAVAKTPAVPETPELHQAVADAGAITPSDEVPRRADPELRTPQEQQRPQPARSRINPFILGGANRENFLGGAPLPRMAPQPASSPQPTVRPKRKPSAPPAPAAPVARRDAVEELIDEIDTAAVQAERARAESRLQPKTEDEESAAPPQRDISAEIAAAPFTTPGRNRPSRHKTAAAAETSLDLDESIPPFDPDAKSGSTAGFAGLAMPPARETDVFSQMSPPAEQQEQPHKGETHKHRRGPTFKDVGEPSPVVPSSRHRGGIGGGRSRSGTEGFEVPPEAHVAGGAVSKGSAKGLSLVEPPHTQTADIDPLTGPRRRVRPAIPDIPPATMALPERRPAVIYAGDEVEINPGQIRKKYVRRVPMLIGLMLALIGATAAGVYALMPVRNLMEARLTYQNLEKRTKRDRDEIQASQLGRLRNDYLREAARRRVLQTPEVSPGFLDDPVQYSRVIDRAYWNEEGNVLRIRYEGNNREADLVRLKALATALYEDNRDTLGKDFRTAKNRVRELEDSVVNNQRRLGELREQIKELSLIYERKPTIGQMNQLEAELTKREESWKRAVAAVKEAEAELARLKQRSITASSSIKAPNSDDELAKMQRELEQLQTKMQSVRDDSSEQARKARERLDAAMEGFQKEITAAAGVSGSNPDFAAYVASAQRLQETTRDVVESMTRRQEQQFESLMELKARLNEKMESRRSEMWQADQELRDLTEKLAILTREYNAAVGAGYREESEEKKAELELTQSMIRARQELIPADPGYADSIQQIELFIASTKKNIEEDRKRTDELLARLQESFTSGPQMEKLPAEQKELARRLKDRLENINQARRQYTQSLDQGASATDKPELQQQIATLQAGIDARRKQLTEQAPASQREKTQQAIQQQQIQIDLLKQEERKSEEGYFATRKELESAKTLVADARNSSEKLEKLQAERSRLEAELKTQNDTLVERQRDLASAIEPMPPTDNDISIREGVDRRPTVLIFASLTILSVFSVLIGLTWRRALTDVPMSVPLSLEEVQPIQHPHPQPGSRNGNGSTSGAPHADDDDHQPAVI